MQLLGKLVDYPIPDIPVPVSSGGVLVDIGCNWGRRSIAAARKRYRVIGIDPQLGAVMAGRRVARELGLDIQFVCGDARYLPFRTGHVNAVFSYSVLQHFSEENCLAALQEIARVLRVDGTSMIQMANAWGLRSAYHLVRRGIRQPRNFEVRYYTPGKLLDMFESKIGKSGVFADCYLGLGLQAGDRHLLPPMARVAVANSEACKNVAAVVPPLTRLADSVYVHSRKNSYSKDQIR